MKWETPAFVEINMSAEIGGYQSDFSDRDPRDPIVQGSVGDDAASPTATSGPRIARGSCTVVTVARLIDVR